VSRDTAARYAEEFLAKLDLTPKRIDELQDLPIERLLALTEPGAKLIPALAPVVDGVSLPADPFAPQAPAQSADIPLLIGTTETEVTFFPNQILDPIDDATLHRHVKQLVPHADEARIDQLVAAYRAGRPRAGNTDLYLIIASDATFRAGVVTEAERKAQQARAPVYHYYFTWRTPVREGKLRSFHTLDIPFVFDNVDAAQSMTGTGPERRALADRMSSAWVAFARTGNPSHPGLPSWNAFDTTRRTTMIFDVDCKAVDDPHGKEQRLLRSLQDA